MVTRSLPEQIGDWSTLSDNLKKRLAELPHAASLQAELAEVVAEARRLEAAQNFHTAQLRLTNEQRALNEARGQEIKNRIEHLLRGYFGGKNPALFEFGFRPRSGGPRKHRRQSAAGESPPETASPAAEPERPEES
jgi:hypothetical protein